MLHKYKKDAVMYSTLTSYKGRIYKIDSIGNYFEKVAWAENPSVNYKMTNIINNNDKIQLHHSYVRLVE
jgi:hypothetical protein